MKYTFNFYILTFTITLLNFITSFSQSSFLGYWEGGFYLNKERFDIVINVKDEAGVINPYIFMPDYGNQFVKANGLQVKDNNLEFVVDIDSKQFFFKGYYLNSSEINGTVTWLESKGSFGLHKTIREYSLFAELCENSFYTSVAKEDVQGPFIVLIKTNKLWRTLYSSDFNFDYPQDIGNIKAIVAVKQSFGYAGDYTSGAKGYNTIWDIRIIKMPEKKVVLYNRLISSAPYSVIASDGDKINAAAPVESFAQWLNSNIRSENSISIASPDETSSTRRYPVNSLAFSSDGKIIMIGGSGGVARWQWSDPSSVLHRGEKINQWELVTRSVYAHDENLLISGDDNGRLCFRDAESLAIKKIIDAHKGNIKCMALGSSDSVLVTGAADNMLKFWSTRTGELSNSIMPFDKIIQAVTFSPDFKTFAALSINNVINIFEYPSLTRVNQFAIKTIHNIYCDEIFWWDDKTLMLSLDNKIIFVDTKTGQEVNSLMPAKYDLMCLAFSKDQRYVAAGDREGYVTIWDIANNIIIKNEKQHTGWVSSLAFSPDGNHLASGNFGAVIKIMDLKN